MIYLFMSVAMVLSVGMAWQEGRKRTCGFAGALAMCLFLSPLFGYFAVLLFPLKRPSGCKWCGNEQNEAEYCGLCGKNMRGELRPART